MIKMNKTWDTKLYQHPSCISDHVIQLTAEKIKDFNKKSSDEREKEKEWIEKYE